MPTPSIVFTQRHAYDGWQDGPGRRRHMRLVESEAEFESVQAQAPQPHPRSEPSAAAPLTSIVPRAKSPAELQAEDLARRATSVAPPSARRVM
jgi:hypothetical protein